MLLTAALDSVPADVARDEPVGLRQERARPAASTRGTDTSPMAPPRTLEIAGAALHEVRYRRLSSRSTTMAG